MEDPIEYVHTHKNAIVNQREVGIDVASYDEGLKLAIREDVDVIQVGRMSEPDTVKAVIKQEVLLLLLLMSLVLKI